jgi:hypothetical protein
MADLKPPEVLQRPLYVFDLPEELLYTLTLKAQPDGQSTPASTSLAVEKNPKPEAVSSDEKLEPSKATSCSLCGLSFVNLQDQRTHVKSDLHNYNLKQKLKGLQPVSEVEFEKLVADLDESISGSESSVSESDEDQPDEKDSTLAALLKRQAKISHPDGDPTSKPKPGPGNVPVIWLGSSNLPQNISLGVYRALFTQAQQADVINTIHEKQIAPIKHSRTTSKASSASNPATMGPSYLLCMIGGGHFAAMIVSLAPKLVHKHTAGRTEREAVVIAHKTFHRYTTRRKQGGSQSASDAAKGAAHSAGSSLRRANEVALTAEVRALLGEWKAMVDKCELIFVRATGSTNRRTLFGPYDGQVLRSNDSRIRSFPFTTRRATQSELMRAFIELTRIKVSHVDEAALAAAALAAAEAETIPSPKPKPATKPANPSPEEESAILHTTQIIALIKRSKVPALLSYIKSNSIDLKTFVLLPVSQYGHTPTPLHFAASLGSGPVISALLIKAGADPCVRNIESKTAAEIAKDRGSRDAFRSARYELGDASWDWDLAGVGASLSPTDAAARDAKEKEDAWAEAKQEAERRRRDTERLRRADKEKEDASIEKRVGKGRLLSEATGAEKREAESLGMTPEMRARLERERRARAAERRMQQ